jgi:hypothetical protein
MKTLLSTFAALKLFIGYTDTRCNSEDLALTPYLYIVKASHKERFVYGIGICWIHSAIYLAIGKNIPHVKGYFFNHNKQKNK